MFLTACNPSIRLTSKVKQTVYPGLHTEKRYINYVLNCSVNTDEIISIDSIHVFQKEKCYKINSYLLKKEKSASYSEKIIEKGNYVLEIPLKEKNISVIANCKKQQDEMIVHYKEGKVSKKMHLDTFVEVRKTKR